MCNFCEDGNLNEFGVEIFEEFTNPVKSYNGIVYKPRPYILKTNGMYFLRTEFFDYKIVACPICGRYLAE